MTESEYQQVILDALREFGIRGRPNSRGQLYARCPYHGGDSSSFAINVKKAVYCCFSAKCGVRGSLSKLLNLPWKGKIVVEQRIVDLDNINFEDAKDAIIGGNKEQPKGNKSELDGYKFVHSYILNRGFSKETVRKNLIGYDKETYSITIPIIIGQSFYGVIRRTVLDDFTPKYLYPKELARNNILYIPLQCQEMKDDEFDCVVVTEGSLDALMVAQNGYYSVSVLGSVISNVQMDSIQKIANGKKIILALDNDKAGFVGTTRALNSFPFVEFWIINYATLKTNLSPVALTVQRIDQLPTLCYTDCVGVKDPGGMTNEELKSAILQSVNRLDLEMALILQ